jgi:cytochrome bd-type quinol oxidase subunit 2
MVLLYDGREIQSRNMMQNTTANVTKVAIACVVCSIGESYLLFQSTNGEAAEYAWMIPCILGLLLATFSMVAMLVALFRRRGIEEAFFTMLCLTAIGVLPAVTALIQHVG